MNTEMIRSFEFSPASLGVTVFDGHSTSIEVNIGEKHLTSEDTYAGRDDGPPVDRGCQAWDYVAATLVLETVIWVSLSIFEAPVSCAHDLATLIYAGVCAVVWCFPELLHGSHFIRPGVQRVYIAASRRDHQPWNHVLHFTYSGRTVQRISEVQGAVHVRRFAAHGCCNGWCQFFQDCK